MQLPPQDELVLVSGCPSIRAKKARYYEDRELQARALPPPRPSPPGDAVGQADRPPQSAGDWADAVVLARSSPAEDLANSGIRREPELPEHEEIAHEPRKPMNEFDPLEDEPDDDAQRLRAMRRQARIARQAALDPADGMGL
jgi:type IV secretion system protein VirD4